MTYLDECDVMYHGKNIHVKIGDTFNRLTITALYRDANSKICALCECSCKDKTKRDLLLRSLLSGNTKSCGCLNKELAVARNVKHNCKRRGTNNKLYNTWVEMRRRCYTHTCQSYPNYGGRGIKVCDDWSEFSAFQDWALHNGYQEGLTIERDDFNGNYEPENCRWIPKSEQSKNRRMCHFIEHNGLRMTVTDWSRFTGISRGTITQRLKRGLPLNEVFKKTSIVTAMGER